jgi:hypothetical protein
VHWRSAVWPEFSFQKIVVGRKIIEQIGHAEVHVKITGQPRIFAPASQNDVPVALHPAEIVVVPSVICTAVADQTIIGT